MRIGLRTLRNTVIAAHISDRICGDVSGKNQHGGKRHHSDDFKDAQEEHQIVTTIGTP